MTWTPSWTELSTDERKRKLEALSDIVAERNPNTPKAWRGIAYEFNVSESALRHYYDKIWSNHMNTLQRTSEKRRRDQLAQIRRETKHG